MPSIPSFVTPWIAPLKWYKTSKRQAPPRRTPSWPSVWASSLDRSETSHGEASDFEARSIASVSRSGSFNSVSTRGARLRGSDAAVLAEAFREVLRRRNSSHSQAQPRLENTTPSRPQTPLPPPQGHTTPTPSHTATALSGQIPSHTPSFVMPPEAARHGRRSFFKGLFPSSRTTQSQPGLTIERPRTLSMRIFARKRQRINANDMQSSTFRNMRRSSCWFWRAVRRMCRKQQTSPRDPEKDTS
ncbi:hypothetical protein NP233_g3185 [Leucocoprinus birnbaumii]|uniref:Uncharacterized protein n=1 Tax=Leucocoprinus birnbaumii TaxID=56174 RepID=A0AAD5VWY5_9AGAR|nr:hypothetical protein NP233_g3185 [Leucocoprinus birnbaumii]